MENETNTSPNSKITVKAAAALWLSEKHLFVKPSSYAKYAHTIQNYILPYLSDKYIDELNTLYLTEYLRFLLEKGRLDGKGGLSPKTVHDIYVIIRSILQTSELTWETTGKISRIPNLWKRAVHISVLDTDSRKKLEKWLFVNADDKRCMGILLCLYTGMRLGEICALKWENIYPDKGFIRVNSTIQRIQNINAKSDEPRTQVICSPPKSLASCRDIPLPQFILELLQKDFPYPQGSCFFLTGKLDFLEPRSYQNCFKHYLSVNKISPVNFHALRHTFATRCVVAGVDIKSLSEILGHASIQMTLNYYVHPSIDDKRRQIELLSKDAF